MIAQLTGTVAAIRLDAVVLDVQGVGYLVHATPATLGAVRHGQSTTLSVTTVVREDAITLYGFADDDERTVFETVQTVSGVGPRLALAMLAVHSPDALRAAVAAGDLKALERVPGIGRKGAQRIVLELSGKLGVPAGGAAPGAVPSAPGDRRGEVAEALVGLGWTAKVAEDAVAQVLAADGRDAVTAADVADTLRAALRTLGGRRG
ncbi:Holliday junction branch migration protein RuvA [Luteimicrobium subarcticum]|uniref:Holliday junction branch migration complex subunit RuvA n=1 Tax=Luteimicrobium subarcticum TaxID=620910 RepID=A0A2M8W413_9MICO|nr:Holliday junction branch migration protein RuvA [Luteimicrobium subarcticum]PJI85650.1 Holliday junction DNA helicase subunit RuvA [Luteimicrobium subarcticum]